MRPEEAERQFRQALRRKPNDVETLRRLATLLRKSNRPGEAAETLQKAIRFTPGKIELYNELLACLMMAGRDDEAPAVAEQAIKVAPKHPIGYFHLGQHFRRQFEPAAAIRTLEEGLSQCGDDWHLRRLLAASYADYGDQAKAVSLFEGVLREDDSDAAAHAEFANALRAEGRLEDARRHLERALQLQPGDPVAVAALAELHESAREYDQAANLVTRAIYSGVQHPEVVFAYARVSKRSNNPGAAVPLLEQIADDASATPSARAQANLILGSLHEELGAIDSAWTRYHAGNELQKGAYDPESIRQTVDALVDLFPPGALASYPRAATRSDRPIYIVGMPRTGTSLVEQILSCHPAVHGSGERHDVSRIGFEIEKRSSSEAGTYPWSVRALTPQMIDALSAEYFERLNAAAPDARHIVDKNPFNFLNLGLIALLAPAARIIHCRRHPLDTCFSIYTTRLSAKNDYSNDLNHIVAFYKQYRRLMDHWQSTLDLTLIDMPYERLVHDLEGETRRMLDALNLEFRAECLAFHKSERYTRTLSQDQVRRPIYHSSIGRGQRFAAHLGDLRDGLRDEIDAYEREIGSIATAAE
ncbi:MAG: tetratricopeptide repeat-containing sulfotransferase family protein [Phycisphaerales bacterium]